MQIVTLHELSNVSDLFIPRVLSVKFYIVQIGFGELLSQYQIVTVLFLVPACAVRKGLTIYCTEGAHMIHASRGH